MTKSIKLLTLYLKKVTKLNENERKTVLFWINTLIHPKIVMAPSKEDIETITGMPTGVNVIVKKDGKFYKAQLKAK